MNDQKGVTLIELMLTITLFTAVLTPLTAIVYYMLTTHRDVVHQNELQHEARFIMEHFSNKLREGARWDAGQKKLLMHGSDGQPVTVLWYDDAHKRILFGEEGAYVASEHVERFDVVPDSSGQNLLLIELELLHPETQDRFRVSTRLAPRELLIEYQAGENP